MIHSSAERLPEPIVNTGGAWLAGILTVFVVMARGILRGFMPPAFAGFRTGLHLFTHSLRGCVKTPGMSAKGAKCNSLGQRPRLGLMSFGEALKARNRNCCR